MKLRLAPALLLILALPFQAAAQAGAVTADSRIASVTVYADRAQVTRSCAVQLQAGTNLVSFESLPLNLAEDSLRAEGSGPGRARISGITVKRVFLERLQDQRIRELEDQIQSLTRKSQGIEAKRSGLNAQKAFIESIRVGWGERISRDLALGKPSGAELNEAAKFVGDGVGRVEEGISDAEAELKPLRDKITALQQELAKARGNRKKEVRSVEVAVEAERPMQFALSLSYLVPDAHWEPGYDVRLGADGTSAELTYRAQVWQRSGEEWPGVKLSLSTAAPQAGGAAPELTPWQVSFWEPPRPVPKGRSFRAMAAPAPPPPAVQEQALAGAAPAADQEEPALPQVAEVSQGQTSVLFEIARPVDVPADGTRAGSVVDIEKLPVTAEYVTVPKLSQRVYLKSEVTNDTRYPLLAGQVNIFNDAIFTGRSTLKTVAAGEKFDLYFGADDQLKVKREVSRVHKKAGLLGGNRVTYHCKVELANFKKAPVTLSLLDQLPLPANAEIKVSLDEAQPRPGETRADGTLVWKVGLAAGEKKSVTYDIVIEYPKGQELSGAE